MSSYSATMDAEALGSTASMLPLTVDWTDHAAGNTSMFTSDYTYAMDSYSCVKEVYVWHIIFAFAVFLTGLGCLITRLLPPRFRKYHTPLGRAYILCMLWCTVTSLVIHNKGLPISTLVSFAGVMIALTIGWVIILIYKHQLNRTATAAAVEGLLQNNSKGDAATSLTADTVEQAIAASKQEILSQQTFWQRYLSFKTLHGALFFASWFQMAGRIFNANFYDYKCDTYMVYKPIDSHAGNYADAPLTIVPQADPNYDRLPWAKLGPVTWSSLLLVGSFLAALVVGAIWHYCDARRQNKAADTKREAEAEYRSESAPASSEIHTGNDDESGDEVAELQGGVNRSTNRQDTSEFAC